MMGLHKLVLNSKPVWAINPQNWTGAPSTGDHVSMKLYQHLTIFIQTGAWAAGTAAVTLEQSTVVAGTDDKALAFTEMWTYSLAPATDLLVRTAVVANTFNLAAATALYIIEIDGDMLDVDNAFDCVELNVATPGANADFYGAMYLLSQARYLAEMPPSAIVD